MEDCVAHMQNCDAFAQVHPTTADGSTAAEPNMEFFEEENDAMIAILKAKGIVPENIEAIVTKQAEEQMMGVGDVIAESNGEND